MKRVKQFARLFTGNPSLLNRIDQNARDFSKALTQISEEYPSGFLDMKHLDSQELMRGLSDLLEHQGKDLSIGEYHERWDQEHINFYYKRRDFLGPYLQKDSQWILGTVNDWLSTFDIRKSNFDRTAEYRNPAVFMPVRGCGQPFPDALE